MTNAGGGVKVAAPAGPVVLDLGAKLDSSTPAAGGIGTVIEAVYLAG